MDHAKHIGRVGALAVALGVGLAVAGTAGVAYAESSESSSASESGDASSINRADGSSSEDRGDGAAESGEDADDDNAADEDVDTSDDALVDDAVDHEGSDSDVDDYVDDKDVDDYVDDKDVDDYVDDKDVDDYVDGDAGDVEVGADTEIADTELDDTDADVVTLTAAVDVAPPAADPEPEPEAPATATGMFALLSAARDERQRTTLRRASASVSPEIDLLADDSPNVLVIGVDGTNLSRILDNPANTNLFALMQDGSTAPASIVGHTTISNPSWSAILTGAWGEKTGVINNVFTPWTYDSWPTVFNQLEGRNRAIRTTAIADWDVISAIADAGSIPVDHNVYVAQIDGDTNWSLTDDAVGDATELAIATADPSVPNFIFSYFVGVDENGHMYGGASPEYAAAITNVDRNIGEIMQAVADWETMTGEQWTVLVVTDHGHQPQKGVGHGFQSPDETATFVIAENPDLFSVGAINLSYQIVDITPTVVTLFGGTPSPDSDGESLTDQGGSDVFPINDDEALRAGLQDVIDKYGYPDIATNVALSVRTIATSVPYFVFGFTNSLTAGLAGLAQQDIFLLSALAKVAIVPVQLAGDALYIATNLVAQIVAKLTGVTGASIFPLWPPQPPSFESPAPESTLDAALRCDSVPRSALGWCAAVAV